MDGTKASPAAAEAIAALRALDADGSHNLVSIDPETGAVSGRTFATLDEKEIAAWVDQHNGRANCYFSANEPQPGAPNQKLGKKDIGKIRAVFSDADPDNSETFDDARRRLDKLAGSLAKGSIPPTLAIDSGNGYQFIWLLAEKLDATDAMDWAESQSRGFAQMVSGDHVQNIDRLLRLPGTVNLPNASKRAKGRTKRPSKLIEIRPEARYDREKLSRIVPPRSKAQVGDPDRFVDAALADIDMGIVEDADTFDELPTQLRKRFLSACDVSGALARLWAGDPAALLGNDSSASGWRASLAARLARAGDFTALDYSQLAWVWPQITDARDRTDHRQLARDWGRMGAPEIAARDALVERWFDNGVPDGADVSAPLFGPAESEQLFQTLTLDELLSARDPKFLVDRHLPERSLGFLYGEPGAKKSFIALDWALHLAFGKPDWHGDTISAKPDGVVLYLAGEGAFGMKARAEAWLQRHEIPSDQRSAGRFYLLPHSVDMMKADQVGKLASTLRRGIAKPVIAIIVDTVSRSMPGADENLQKDMTLFVRACDRLKEEFDCTVLGVHHASKSGALRGSSVLAGAGDFVFRMDCKKGALAGKLHCEKQKDAPDGWADAYRFDVIYLSDGRSSLVPARAAQEGAAVSPEVTGRIFDAMRVAWDAGEPWAKSMHKSGERGAVRRIVSDFGIDADHAAMLLDLWERTGEIIEEIFDNRNKRRGYRVAEVDVEEADDVLE